ncbi:hypothetical protein PIB30_028997 [Stylosanthes scabra]|uniref:Uncharacterized protein n=1 Tax=Stylosanthes scabra TaxID=79078 RepID=A0ABU6WAW0_9FABA|nr:hypothetical protein [Stylosanthes scabra]
MDKDDKNKTGRSIWTDREGWFVDVLQGSQESSGSASGGMDYKEMPNSETGDEDLEQLVRIVEGTRDFGSIDFSSLIEEDIQRFEFTNLQAAYDFYNEYGRIKGFSVRTSKMGRHTKVGSVGEIL